MSTNQPTPWARRRLLRTIAVAGPAIALAGCQLPGSGPAPRTFRLKGEHTIPAEVPTVDWALSVDPIQAPREIDTTRIARLSGAEFEYYAESDWVDRPPRMLEVLLFESFRNSGKIEVVSGRNASIRPDFVLKAALREFQAETTADGPVSVYVQMTVGLQTMPKREIVGTTEIESLVVAEAKGIEAIIAAFDEAAGSVLRDVVVWTLQTGQAAVA